MEEDSGEKILMIFMFIFFFVIFCVLLSNKELILWM